MAGLAYNYVLSDRFDLAELLFKQALSGAPGDYGLQKGLAVTYICSGRAPQALRVLRLLQARQPDDLEVLAAIASAQAAPAGRDADRFEHGIHNHGAGF